MKNRLKALAALLTVTAIFSSCSILPESIVDAITGASLTFSQDGNSLFHQTDQVKLTPGELTVKGEVKGPGKVNLRKFYKREVVIKESLFDRETGIQFTGAYRYSGYSLFDLLHGYNLEKENSDLFRPQIDAYIVIENRTGDKVVFSWSEIFHTVNPHQILIATEMAPIIPYRQEVDYPTGDKWRVVSAGDLFAFRTLDDPVKITVHSFNKREYLIDRDIETLYSDSVRFYIEENHMHTITPQFDFSKNLTYNSTFYRMGMGHHHTDHFTGPPLSFLLQDVTDPYDPVLNRSALVCFASVDGYRAIYSYSELFNRTDQTAPILAIAPNEKDGGFFRNFHPVDFYADRSVKALQELFVFQP